MDKSEFLSLIKGEKSYKELKKSIESKSAVEVKGITGSAISAVCSALYSDADGVNIFIADSKDEAAYLYNDMYALTASEDIYFFPTGYKRSIEYGNEDPSGRVQRTAVLNALRNKNGNKIFICTYPEAVLEQVVDAAGLADNTLTIKTGDTVSQDFIREVLADMGFMKVDFVYEPGQFSIRGGIVDIFSFSDNSPYRIDFFGDEVESIRMFDIGTQLSVNRTDRIEIIPDLKNFGQTKVSLLKFAGKFNLWVNDFEFTMKRFADGRVKFINEVVNKDQEPETVDRYILIRNGFCEDIADNTLITLRTSYKECKPEAAVSFSISPQPAFNKKFDILADTINDGVLKGYKTYILTENKVQIERLENIFNSAGRKNVPFEPFPITLHEGYTDHDLKINFFTDHQIFDRYHKYTLRKEVKKSESITIAELNSLKIGDYVVHIDHGVGRFGGLVRSVENGKITESIKLIYRDNDILFVNVHALHRISKYKDKNSEPPKIYKLGSGAWQKLKANTKRHVKDIARELIALYAKRKQSKGYAFSHDSFLQHELEASFMYEDTPDQEKAMRAVKADMESDVPMDRLICGDVGFGKTEIAIRAAFKAACDSKQVAVLVPTTVLSLQHYRTFSKRFREFPVKVELLSRAKSTKQVNEIINDLREGKIDIVIGTHKLLNKKVEFKDLGLLIIDEEQKFGVSSKEKLRQIKANVDTLTLTATPIPRTLQFSLMGSRDMSVIATPPPNRQPVTTEVHTFNDDIIREAIEFEMSRNGQIYFIHNRVQDILSMRDRIQKICPEARIAVGHGQMKSEELEKIMMDFIYGEYDLLLATTIIESGIDISNANTIIINNAQNFGLSDLHQLKGRVGRSNRKAYCYLITPPEESLSTDSRKRLKAIEDFSDLGSGFNIAMQDLDIRGAGNILGSEQSGFIADIGFETYQKILNEAVMELREEEFADTMNVDSPSTVEGPPVFITDSQIETDREAFIPDSYISNTAEKISLYRELDNIVEEDRLREFESRLTDRFGEPPVQVRELYNIIRLRRLAVKLGFEKVIQKNGLMILHFVYNQSSVYYKSNVFTDILKFISEKNVKFLLKQHNNRLQITVKSVRDSADAYGVLTEIAAATEVQ
ncbi:MAG: transcription-repair coupling factor [Rikenellaceae bacterium]|nr:transcription-repair coupling factor [Rikenellaceae bacterium]